MQQIMKAEIKGKKLEVTAYVPQGVKEIAVIIRSDRNSPISRLSDISDCDPEGEEKKKSLPSETELWFPVVDIELEAGMKAIARFDHGQKGMCSVNGLFNKKLIPYDGDIVIPMDVLEYWENSIYTDTNTGSLYDFHIVKNYRLIPDTNRRFNHTFKLLSRLWSGSISIAAADNPELREIMSIKASNTKAFNGQVIPTGKLEYERLLTSVKASVDFIMNCQVRTPHSPLSGGLYSFYDLDAKTYRMNHWIWGWGPPILLLLEASRIPELNKQYEKGRLYETACEIGYTSTRMQVYNEDHETHGLGTVRWDPVFKDPASEIQYGYSEYITGGSDSNFLSAWAWIPLYMVTGDRHFLESAELLANTTERLMGRFELIPQDYAADAGKWTDHTLDESGFGVEGIAELYRVTGNERYKETGRRYMEQHLSKLQRDDGLWQRMWIRSKGMAKETMFMTRGQGWAMEGLLATYRLTGDKKYLELAVKMAEQLMKYQHETGVWPFMFNRPLEEVSAGEKGTALWSLLFYKLYSYTGDERHLESARKALLWCIDNQYTGHDRHAYGGIVSCHHQSAVVYRRWFHVCCSYASGFFGLAALEELKLQGLIE